MNLDEPQVNLKFRSKQLTSSKTAEGSQRTWRGSRTRTSRASTTTKSVRSASSSRTAFPSSVEKQIEDKEMELVAKQHELMGQYPDTYLAKFLGWRNPKYPKSQGNYFDDMDPMDNSLVRSMAISDRIQGFMVAYSKGNDPGFLACIDLVKAHFEPNPSP